MRAAVGLADIVGERENLFGVAVVILNRHFEELVVALLLFEINGLFEQNFFSLVYIFDKVNYAALVTEAVVPLFFAAQVGQSEF